MTNPYDSRWQAIRPGILARDHHTCQIAGPGCTHTATDVDHIIPWNEGGQRLDPTNLRAACSHCNSRRPHQRHKDLLTANTPPPGATPHPPTPSRTW